MSKISLVITVYNKAPFLERCLDSIVEQEDKSAQVIVVDDGSTDGSGEICDRYEKYGFEIYHITNGGVSSARNFGIDRAKNDYIAFLDGDDALSPDAIKVMSDIANRGYNISQFGQYRHLINKPIQEATSTRGVYKLTKLPKHWVMVWNKVYKRSFLKDNNIRFNTNLHFGEDEMFNIDCLLKSNLLYCSSCSLVHHYLDDNKSLCRGQLNLARIKAFDDELFRYRDMVSNAIHKSFISRAIRVYRNSELYKTRTLEGNKGSYDIVYFLKDTPENEELKFSLRSIEKNFQFRDVVFYGGCPKDLTPDRCYPVVQNESSKWANVRRMMMRVFENNDLTEDIWLFNDDFFILKPIPESMPPQYNGDLFRYIVRAEEKSKQKSSEWTRILRKLALTLEKQGKGTLNYELHKPMLINRKKALEVLKKFPTVNGFRSLYGNYYEIGGINKSDQKIQVVNYPHTDKIRDEWEFVSTDDDSFTYGTIGKMIRDKFPDRSRFES